MMAGDNLLLRIHRRLLPADAWIGWTPYLWLIYLGIFYFKLFATPPAWSEIAATALATGLFLYLYFSGYWRKGRDLTFNIFGIAAIGAVMAPINSGAGVFFIYAGAYAPFVGSARAALAIVASLLAVVALETVSFGLTPGFWIPAAFFTPLIALANFHFASVAGKDAALERSQDEVERLATVAERERIARDLHDLLGHTLSVIALKSELARKLLERDRPAAGEEIREVERISRQALTEVREAVAGYRRLGLEGEAEKLGSALKSAGIACEIELNGVRPPPVIESALAMALREGVTNVIRHSRANHCRIALEQRGRTIELSVRDDGCGGEYAGGNGLAGMRDRVQDLRGTVTIVADRGTLLRIALPLDDAAAA